MIRKISILTFALAFLSSCTSNLGDFTAISTANIRGLDYDNSKSSIALTEGTSCLSSLFLIPLGDDSLFKEAVYNAIRNGKKSGKLDGDLLVNARAKVNKINLLFWGKKCVTIQGELVSSKGSKK